MKTKKTTTSATKRRDYTSAYQRLFQAAREAGRDAWKACGRPGPPGMICLCVSARGGFARWLLEHRG
jgi:hypothetical protein